MTRIELLTKPQTTQVTEDISTTVEFQNFVVTDNTGALNPSLLPLKFNTGTTIVTRITSINNGKYILNGDFTTVNGGVNTAPDIAIYSGTTYLPNELPITTTSSDSTIGTVEDNDFYYVAGDIQTVGSNTNIKNIYKISKTGPPNVIDTTFTTNVGTGPNGDINGMVMFDTVYGKKLIIGGNFTSWNGTNTGPMVILNLNGTIWAGLGAQHMLTGYINNFKEYLGTLVVFGSLSMVNGNNINNWIQLNSDLNVGFNNIQINYGSEINDVTLLIDTDTLEVASVFATPNGLWVEGLNGGATYGNLTPGVACNTAQGVFLNGKYTIVAAFGNTVRKWSLTANYTATEDTTFKLKTVDGFITQIRYDETNKQYLYGGLFTLVSFKITTPPQVNQNKLAYGYLDIDDKTAFPINMGVADIRDISKKTGTFSKTITLLGTPNNHKLLNHLYDLNIKGSDFDVNKITYCNVIQNGVTIIKEAIFQLVSVNKEQQTNSVEEKLSYSALIKDSASDFFNIINQKKLEDLKCFDWLNHNLTSDKVIESFSHTEVDGYKYVMPMGTTTGATAGTYLTGDTVYNLEEFVPGIYAKKYFDSIVAQAGFTYQWDSLTDKDIQFDKLIIPYNGDIQKSDKSESVEYNASVTSTIPNTISTRGRYYILGGNGILFIDDRDHYNSRHNVDYNVENYDYSNLFDLNTNWYTTPNIPSNQNSIQFDYEYDYEIVVNNMDNQPAHLLYLGTSFYIKGNKALKLVPYAELLQNESWSVATSEVNQSAVFDYGYVFTAANHPVYPVGVTTLKSGTTKGSFTENLVTPGKKYKVINGMRIEPNVTTGKDPAVVTDKWAFRLSYDANNGRDINARFEIRVTQVRLVVKFGIQGALGYNYPIKMNNFVPKNIKQADFVKSIFTMYNLFCESDKLNPNKLIIQGRDGYYDDGIVLDWSNKLIKDEGQEVKFLNDVSKKKQIITYKQDNDLPNTNYFTRFNEVYGQVEYTYDSEFVKDIDKKELVFSPTPISNLSNGAIVPMLLGPAPKTNIRILYDGGPYTCGGYDIINYQGNIVKNNTFPYLSHFDRPFNPTFDINFATCDDYYDKTIQSITNNNLFNLHWRRTINQINNGKMLTASFILTENDIRDIKLNSKIKVGNSWFQINKIMDYDANTIKPTKVELITADDGIKIPFIAKPLPVSINNNAKYWVEGGMFRQRVYQTNYIETPGDFQINGINNTVESGFRSGIVDGNNNRVGTNAIVFGDGNLVQDKNIVMGNYNTITPGVTNSIIIGEGLTGITQSNTLYTDSIVLSSGGTLNGLPIEDIESLVNTPIDTYVTGGTYSSGTAVFTNNSGGTFNVTGFNTGSTNLWIATNSTNPTVNPIATGIGSIAIGNNAVALSDETFIVGLEAGVGGSNILGSTFIGSYAGSGATNANTSNFIGNSSGIGAIDAYSSNFIGISAGVYATDAYRSNFIGPDSGRNATNANNSNFIGVSAGFNSTNAHTSNFIGSNAGKGATNANTSNFIGDNAGFSATGASNSNFFGFHSGDGATDAYRSNFIGPDSGRNATNASYSNFIGEGTGFNATNASNSNFIGFQSGKGATNSDTSNFIGFDSGNGATDSYGSNFIGYNSGKGATNSYYSNLIGYRAGETFTSNNISTNNIIIGTNISLPNGAVDRINLGGILFGSGTYFTQTGNPSIVPTSTGKIGVGVVSPTANLHIKASTTASALMRLEVGPAPSSPNDGDIWLQSNTLTGLKIRIGGVTRTITIT